MDFGRPELTLTRSQVDRLFEYDWPGNVRELKNVIERAVILSPGNVLRLDLSMPNVTPQQTREADVASAVPDGILTEKQMREFQKQNLLNALRETSWRVSGPDGAAELLGVKPTTLADRIRAYGLRRPARR